MGALDGEVAAFLEQEPGADGIGHRLSQLLLGFLATEVVPLANRLAELGIDPTPLLATTREPGSDQRGAGGPVTAGQAAGSRVTL